MLLSSLGSRNSPSAASSAHIIGTARNQPLADWSNAVGAALLAGLLSVATLPSQAVAQAGGQDTSLVKERNVSASRVRATQRPRSEGDQALVDGWPLYRTERGQAAFNDAMAALKATDGAAPTPKSFKGCTNLECEIALPAIGTDGWIPAGRVWVSPTEYVLIAHSPRQQNSRGYRRRGLRDMRYFVFHEFHNSSRNTDVFDTISSHSGSVFVPLYMSKQGVDARGHRFVIVMQVAPYDVVSIHASNYGSAGPGIEVARNVMDTVEPLQQLAGILVATIVKAAAPHLRVVNHRGTEGLPMLGAYDRRLAALRGKSGGPSLTLPFMQAAATRMAAATGRLDELITRNGASPKLLIAERTFLPPKPPAAAQLPPPSAVGAPKPAPETVSALATYLIANLATMKQSPNFAGVIPQEVAAVAEESPAAGVVYLFDESQQVIGRIEAYRDRGTPVRGRFVYSPIERTDGSGKAFELDLSRPLEVRAAALAPQPGSADPYAPTLIGPIKPAVRSQCAVLKAQDPTIVCR